MVSKGIETRYGFDSFLVEFMLRVYSIDGYAIRENAGLEINFT